MKDWMRKWSSLPQYSVDDKRAVDVCERSVKGVDGHHQIDIRYSNLPENRIVARKQLQSLAKRFLRIPPWVIRQVEGRNSVVIHGQSM